MIGISRVAARELDEGCRLEAVHVRHLRVEDDRGDVLLEQGVKRLCAGVGEPALQAEGLEHRLESDEVVGPVVDQQHSIEPGCLEGVSHHLAARPASPAAALGARRAL